MSRRGKRKSSDGMGKLMDEFGFTPNRPRDRETIIANMYVRILTELSLNRFKWIGLPDSVDPRYMEMQLQYGRLIVFYWDKRLARYMCVLATGLGVNPYQNPTMFRTCNPGISSVTLKPEHCVPVYGNMLRVPDLDVINIYAQRLATIDVTNDVNLMAMRHPFIVSVEDSQRLSIANFFKSVTQGEPIVYGYSGLPSADSISVLDMQIHPDTLPKMNDVKAKVWNEVMTLLGINNANQDKRERLVADEVSANNDQIVAQRGTALNARRFAAAEITRLSPTWGDGERHKGLHVEVEWNDSVYGMASETFAHITGDDS